MSESNQNELLAAARDGNLEALQQLFAEQQAALFRLTYRMLGNRADAQDLLQEYWLRGQRGIGAFRGQASAMKAWWFGIASHLALDYLRLRKRWRVEAQLIGEQELDSQPDEVENLAATMSEPDFRYEVKEHISFALPASVARSNRPRRPHCCFAKCSSSAMRTRHVFSIFRSRFSDTTFRPRGSR
jgi:RNA polymerase sigma-70 factor (ECF subfamily)